MRQFLFQALIGTVETDVEREVGVPHELFQALIGTVETLRALEGARILKEFQALIGTVETRACGMRRLFPSCFKPS